MLLNAYRFSSGEMDNDARMFINRFSVEPDDIRKNAINQLFLSLKDSGIYNKLDSLYIAKQSQDTQSALLDWKRPTKSATLHGTALAEPIYGFYSPLGLNDNFISSDYIPSRDGINFQPNSAGIGCLITVTPKDTTSARLVGTRDSNLDNTFLVNMQYDGSNHNTYLTDYWFNGSSLLTGITRAGEDTLGILQMNRTASDRSDAYFAGLHTDYDTYPLATRGLSSNEIPLGSYNDQGNYRSYGVTKQAAWWFGAPLDLSEESILNTILETYFDTVMVLDPDYLSLLSRMTVQPNSSLANRLKRVIRGLKEKGIWDKLDSLYIPKGIHTAQAARLDWKRSSISALPYNSVLWSTGAGFEGDGVSAYVNTLFTPSVDGVKFTLNNFGIGCYITEINPVSNFANTLFGSRQNSNKYLSMSVTTNEQLSAELCSGSSITSPSPTSYNGFHHVNRTSSSTAEIFKNALSLFSTNSNASVGLPSFPVYLLASNLGSLDSPSKVKIGCWYAGSSLTTTEQSALNSILETFWASDFVADTSTFNYSTTLLEIGKVVINPIEQISYSVPTFTQINYI